MNFQVSSQVRFVRESFLASRVCAGVGLLASVDPDVVGEEPGPRESLGTVATLVVPAVGLHVHGQGWHGGVVLVAHSTVSALLCVDLSVSGEVAARGEVFPAVRAVLQFVRSSLDLALSVHGQTDLQAGAGVLRVLRDGGGGGGGPGGGETQVESFIFLLVCCCQLEDGVGAHDIVNGSAVHVGVRAAAVSGRLRRPEQSTRYLYPAVTHRPPPTCGPWDSGTVCRVQMPG